MGSGPDGFNKSKYDDFVIVADVGGTNTSFAVFGITGNSSFEEIFREHYDSREIKEFYICINEILKTAHERYNIQISHACFDMAGPTEPDRSYGKLTNLPWAIDVSELLRNTMLQRILLLNDIESIGFGIPFIDKKDASKIIQLMNPDGTYNTPVEKANCCIVAPGTGLGTGIMVYESSRKMYMPVPSEAGHVEFPASDEEEWGLIEYLRKEVTNGAHPGYERVLSGQGMVNIYSYLRSIRYEEDNDVLRRIDSLSDEAKPAEIHRHFTNSSLCHKCVDMFISSFAKRARNLALTTVSFGGVYLAGGIPPKMVGELQKPHFMEMFESVDKLRHLIHKIPVYVVLDYGINLIGCCSAAVNFMDLAYVPG